MTHYEVLGVARDASTEEIKRAYRRLSKTAHPDAGGDPARFTVITQAYDVLSDAETRRAYDRSLAVPVSAPARAPWPRWRKRSIVIGCVLAAIGAIGWWASPDPQRLGDDCLVGMWRAEDFDTAFRNFLAGREIHVVVRGGGGMVTTVEADGSVTDDYAGASPVSGTGGGYRVEGRYAGTSTARWLVTGGGTLRQFRGDGSRMRFDVTINGQPPDQPSRFTPADREFPYRCTPTALELGDLRYTRISAGPSAS